MTPEGKVKEAVKTLLIEQGCVPAAKAPLASVTHHGWFFMPVGGPMSGVSGIPDFIGHFYGRFFSVESKTEKKDPTALQMHQINAINITGAKNFIIRGAADVEQLRVWLTAVEKEAL